MTRYTRLYLFGLALGIMMIGGSQVGAAVINGSFESGMSGWSTVGPNSVVPNGTINGFSATDGSFYAYIHNGVGAQSVVVQDFVLASVGIPSGYIASNYPNSTQGAVLFQTFDLCVDANAISFNWNFLTDESPASTTFNDFAFALLYDNTANAVAATAYYDTFSLLLPGGPEYFSETGWQNVVMAGLTGGQSYTLAFGVFDREDTVVDSVLLVDDVRCVPEPSGLALVLVGLLATGFRRRAS